MYNTDMDLLEMIQMEQLFSEEYIEEGLFFNKLPKDLEELKNKLKQNTKEKYNEIVKSTTIGHRLKHGIKYLYPKVVDESLKKSGINPKSIIHTVTTDSNGASYDTYDAFFIYKNYIVSARNVDGGFNGLKLLYDPDKCQIPKNVAFDLFNSTRTNERFKSGKDSVTSAGLNDDGKALLSKMENKYSDEYDVKRNPLTDSVTISIKKKK